MVTDPAILGTNIPDASNEAPIKSPSNNLFIARTPPIAIPASGTAFIPNFFKPDTTAGAIFFGSGAGSFSGA